MNDARRVSIVIPTSAGPSAILSIREEEAEIGRSVVCLAGTAQEVGIGDYNAFVRQPTGIIERLFGHAAYRMDVSARIDAGSSWQLAAFLAHALKAAGGRLHEPLLDPGAGEPDLVVFATGAVRSIDLAVVEVGHVADKLATARALLERARTAGRTVHVFVPAANRDDVDPEAAQWLAAAGIAVTAVERVDEALAMLGLPPLSRAASAVARRGERTGPALPGLAAYGESDRAVFFGRAWAREECLDKLRRAAARGRAFLMIHGRSGAGKSSLAQAGLAGDVAANVAEGGAFRTAVMTPSVGALGPVAALADALAKIVDGKASASDLLAALRERGAAAIAEVEALARPGARGCAGLLIVDQFEELLAAPEPHPETDLFARCLEALARGGAVWTVATMRSDFLGLLDRLPRLSRLAADERSYRLDRPSRHDLVEIVTAPAALAGLRFAAIEGRQPLSEELADKAHRSPDSLPLLQIVLTRLFAQADPTGLITAESYERIGKFEGAVAAWADDVVQELVDEGAGEEAIDRLLVDLVGIDRETGRGLARPVVRRDDEPDPAGAAAADWRLLRELATPRRRLVSIDAENGVVSARLVHEILILHWPRLARLIDRLRLLLVARDRLQQAAESWAAGGRDPVDLLRGAGRLEQAQDFLAQAVVPIPPLVEAFVGASAEQARGEAEARRRAAEAAERSRRFKLRALTGGLALAVVTAGMVGWLLWNQSAISATLRSTVDDLEASNRALAAERTAKEEALRASESDRAAKERSLQEVRLAKVNALTSSAYGTLGTGDVPAGMNILIEALSEAEAEPAIASVPYTEQLLASAVWQVRQTSYAPVRTIDAGGTVGPMALSEDGKTLALAVGGRVTVHGLAGAADFVLPDEAEPVIDLAFLPATGALVVVTPHRLVAWDLDTRRPAETVAAPAGFVCAWGAGPKPTGVDLKIAGTSAAPLRQPKMLRVIDVPGTTMLTALFEGCRTNNDLFDGIAGMMGYGRLYYLDLGPGPQGRLSNMVMILANGALQLSSPSLNRLMTAEGGDRPARFTDGAILRKAPRMVVARDDGRVAVYAAHNGAIEALIPVADRPATRIVASDGGATLAVLIGDREVRILGSRVADEFTEAERPPGELDLPATPCAAGAATPEIRSRRGDRRVRADGSGLTVSDFARTAPARRLALPAEGAAVRALALTPDARRLLVAFTVEAGQTLMLADYPLDRDGAPAVRRIGAWSNFRCAAIKPDGSAIAALSPSVAEWFFIGPDGVEARRTERGPGFPAALAFSASGRRTFMLTEDDMLTVWDTESGVQLTGYGVPKPRGAGTVAVLGTEDETLWLGSPSATYRVRFYDRRGSLIEAATALVAYCPPSEWRVRAGLKAALPDWCAGKPPPPPPPGMPPAQ